MNKKPKKLTTKLLISISKEDDARLTKVWQTNLPQLKRLAYARWLLLMGIEKMEGKA